MVAKDEGISDSEFGMKKVVVWLCSRGVGEVAKGSGGGEGSKKRNSDSSFSFSFCFVF